MGGNILPINKETQVEETAAKEKNACPKNQQNKSTTVNGNGKWCDQDRINNKQN